MNVRSNPIAPAFNKNSHLRVCNPYSFKDSSRNLSCSLIWRAYSTLASSACRCSWRCSACKSAKACFTSSASPSSCCRKFSSSSRRGCCSPARLSVCLAGEACFCSKASERACSLARSLAGNLSSRLFVSLQIESLLRGLPLVFVGRGGSPNHSVAR